MREKTAKKILAKVKKTYDEIAEDFSQTRDRAWPEFEKFSKHLKSHFEILDLGCGNGRLYQYLKPANYLGIDSSKKLLDEARKLHPEGKFIEGDQQEIPTEDGKFNVVFSIAALHHIPSKKLRKKTISEIVRVLKKDGILILTVWNLFQKKYLKYLFKGALIWLLTLGKYDWNDTFIPWGKEKLPRYYHAFTEKELRRLLKKDFEILELNIGNNILAICRKR